MKQGKETDSVARGDLLEEENMSRNLGEVRGWEWECLEKQQHRKKNKGKHLTLGRS